ncbi:TenA family protein [Roseomonas sp. CCTCC AB2023176]|uniref:TenA family protein n=1 Tax=Roseomonas sp. CCTCC AB2023176 TaxID=3342640 RepID=UPI0035DD1E07
MMPYGKDGGLYRTLRDVAAAEWEAYCWHSFVQGLADGTLPLAAFRRYLVQDYLFLVQFARAEALAVVKAESLAAMREKAGVVQAILGETRLHLDYCRDWGLDEAAILAEPEAPETVSYTRWVMDAGYTGDILDLEVALSPCTIGYGEIANRIEAHPSRVRSGNPYESWIAMYAGEEYQSVARASAARLDALGETHGGMSRLPALTRLFAQGARLEADFWQMGLNAAREVTPNLAPAMAP